MRVRTISLYDTTDWGDVNATDLDRENYEEAVAAAILEAFPGTKVTVQCLQRYSPRVVVTTRGEDRRILTDDATLREESDIEQSVLLIASEVWDRGEFWGPGS